MKKKLLVFLLTICILISFVACSAREEPVITSSYEDTFATENSDETTASSEETAPEQTEKTASSDTASEAETGTATEQQPIMSFGYMNISFRDVRSMIEMLKKGEVDVEQFDFSDKSWLEVDYDGFYELSGLPEGYTELGVGWTGNNNYQITYYRPDPEAKLDDNTPLLIFTNCSSQEEMQREMASSFVETEEEIRESFSLEIIVESEETEYGVLYTYRVADTGTYFQRMDVTDENGELLWLYYVKYYSHDGLRSCYLFNFSGDALYRTRTRNLDVSFEDLLSLKPVKVEADG